MLLFLGMDLGSMEYLQARILPFTFLFEATTRQPFDNTKPHLPTSIYFPPQTWESLEKAG